MSNSISHQDPSPFDTDAIPTPRLFMKEAIDQTGRDLIQDGKELIHAYYFPPRDPRKIWVRIFFHVEE